MPASDLNHWVQLAGTYDGTAWNLYRDGQPIATTADATGAVPVNADWVIGAGAVSGDRRFFSGGIADAQIYGAALSASDVEALSGGLAASYPFAEGSGTTTADASGNGHSGTLAGGVAGAATRPPAPGPPR